MSTELKCPNCGSVEFTECADVPTVNRDFRVPADSSKHIRYGHEYSSGDIDHIEYMCHKCGLQFEATDEEDFRKELSELNELFAGPVWMVHENSVIRVTCEKVDYDGIWVKPENGDHFLTAMNALHTAEDAARERLVASLEFKHQMLMDKIAKEKEALEALEAQMKEFEKNLNL